MAGIPLPALDVKPVQQPDALENFGRILALKQQQALAPIQQQMAQTQLAEAQQNLAGRKALSDAYQGAVTTDSSGKPTFNQEAITQSLASKGFGYQIPGVLQSLNEAQKIGLENQKAKGEIANQEANYVGHLAYAAHQANDDPSILAAGLQHAVALGYQTAGQALQSLQQDPTKAPAMIQHLISGSPDVQKLINEQTQAQAKKTESEKPNEALLAQQAATPGPQQAQAQAALEKLQQIFSTPEA